MSDALITELYYTLSNGGMFNEETLTTLAMKLETRGMQEKDDTLVQASRALRYAVRTLRVLDSNLPRVNDHE